METPEQLWQLLPDRLPLLPADVGYSPAGTESLQAAGMAAETDGKSLFPAKPAVYVLLDDADRPILLSCTANLRLGLQRRCADPPMGELASRRTNYRQITKSIAYRRVNSAFAANLWYSRAARVVYPKDYHKFLGWKPAWLLRVDATEDCPRFSAMAANGPVNGEWIGPFADSRSAREALETLEELFDLCRYYEILRQAPHGKACAYKQMGKCPAPCDGSIAMADYRRQVVSAIEFMVGRDLQTAGEDVSKASIRQGWRQAEESRMRAVAAKLDFMVAARIKTRLDVSRRLDGGQFDNASKLKDQNYVIVQPGEGKTRIEPFFFYAGRIVVGHAVALKQLSAVLPQWLEQMSHPVDAAECSTDNPADMISLLCYHRFRSRDSGLYMPVSQVRDVDDLHRRIHAWLEQKKPKSDTMESAESFGESAMAHPATPAPAPQ